MADVTPLDSPADGVDRLLQPGQGIQPMGGEAGIVVTTADRPRDKFEDPARGDVTWFTLISGELTPSARLSAGIAELPPGGPGLALHRHAEAEIYHVLGGTGVVTIAGVATPVATGSTVFIPGDAEHGIRNVGSEVLRIFYVFPTDRFADVVYRFTPLEGMGGSPD